MKRFNNLFHPSMINMLICTFQNLPFIDSWQWGWTFVNNVVHHHKVIRYVLNISSVTSFFLGPLSMKVTMIIKLQQPWLIFPQCLLIFHEFQKRKCRYLKSPSTLYTYFTLFWSMMAEEHVVLLADEFVKIILKILDPTSSNEQRHAAILVNCLFLIISSFRT